MPTIHVTAAPLSDPALGGKARVVKEGTTQRYITEQEPVEIELTPYYQRKLHAGELVEVPPPSKRNGLHEVVTSTGEDDDR